MAEEMRAHLDGLIERNIAAGMPPDEARDAALQTFGGVAQIQERCRDEQRVLWVENTWRDIRHAFRLLFKAPLLSATIVISLGIGIGANTTIFSWIQAVVLRPLPGVPDGAEFNTIESRTEANAFPGWSWLDYRDLNERLSSFRELLSFEMTPLNVGEPGRNERVYSQFVSGNFFSALGLQPALGRFFQGEEVMPSGGAPVVVISHSFWQARFGGAPSAVGQTLRANNQILTIIGVAPPQFRGTVMGLGFDLWVPAAMAPVLSNGSRELETRDARGYRILGRLRAGVDLAAGQRELDAAMAHLAHSYPESHTAMRAEVRPFTHPPRGPQQMLINGLLILQGITLLVLIVVCANTANLLLARATARKREMGVRIAIGAGPWRIAGMLAAESLVLALLGAALGGVLAVWGTDALRALPVYGGLPIRFDTSLDVSTLMFAIGLALTCGVAFGIIPALQLAKVDPYAALHLGGQSSGRSRLRSSLVALQSGIAVIVLIFAAFFFRNLADTTSTDPGFTRDGVLLTAYDLSGYGYKPEVAKATTRELLDQLRTLPGVEAVAIASAVPLDIHGLPSRRFTVEGRGRETAGADEALTYNVTRDYFRVMGLSLVAGTDFADLSDTTQEPQVIVNEEFTRLYLNGKPDVGRHLEADGTRYQIIGVVKNSIYEAFGESHMPMVYFSFRDRFRMSGQLHLRTRGGENALIPVVRRTALAVNPAIQIYDARTMTEHVDRNLIFKRVPARMFALLGPLILLLAAIGVYAVAAYAVAQRTLEIGVRRALGATENSVVFQIVREGMRSVITGTSVGGFLVFVVNLHLRRGVAVGPEILLGVPVLLLAVAAFACWLPARRAAHVDPAIALRHE